MISRLSARKKWLAVPSSSNNYVAGTPVQEYTLHLEQGWHLIGGVSSPVDFSDPNDSPNGAVLAAYDWDALSQEYVPTSTLYPNTGYWIAVIEECDLTVGEEISLAKTGTIQSEFVKPGEIGDQGQTLVEIA